MPTNDIHNCTVLKGHPELLMKSRFIFWGSQRDQNGGVTPRTHLVVTVSRIAAFSELYSELHVCMHCKEILIYVFPEKKLRDLSPIFHIHVSVSDLFIPTIGPPIFLQQNRQTDRRNTVYCIYRSQKHECRNWERGNAVSFLGIFVSNFWYNVFEVWRAIQYCTVPVGQPKLHWPVEHPELHWPGRTSRIALTR